MDCESRTPTQGVTQKRLDCESLTPTQGATQPPGGGGGVTETGLMRPTPQLSIKTRGGGAGGSSGGGLAGGCRGGILAVGGFSQGGGGLRATHYYHMHTSWGLCVWGFGGTDVCMR